MTLPMRAVASLLTACWTGAFAQDVVSPASSDRLKEITNQAVLGEVRRASEVTLNGILSPETVRRLERKAGRIEAGKALTSPNAVHESLALSDEIRARLAFKALGTVASVCGESIASPSQFLAAADAVDLDSALRDKVQRAFGLGALAGSVLRRTNPYVVCGGTATNLTPHPEPKPVGFKNETGKPSAAKAGHLEEPYKAGGFREVVALVYKGKFKCSATMISQRWILTAAHCVVDSSDQRVAVSKADLTYFVYTETGSDCFTSDDTLGRTMSLCGRKQRSAVSVVLPDGWVAAASQPGFPNALDHALIEIGHEDSSVGASVSIVASLPPAASDITIAGYGFTASAQDVAGDIISVGWNKLDPQGATKGVFQWQYLSPAGQSSTCHGDSGGPLMLGRMHGEPGEKHLLFAVVSSLELAEGEAGAIPVFPGVAASCLQRVATNSLLSDAATLQWLCRNAGPKVDGCSIAIAMAKTRAD